VLEGLVAVVGQELLVAIQEMTPPLQAETVLLLQLLAPV
jgi:hypothetical protein